MRKKPRGAHLIQKEKPRKPNHVPPRKDPKRGSSDMSANSKASTLQAPAKSKKWWKILLSIVCGSFLVAVAIGLFINSKLNLIDYDDGVKKVDEQEIELVLRNDEQIPELDTADLEKWEELKLSELEIAGEEGVFNLLLLGTDTVREGYYDDCRADAVMILSLNMNDNTAKLISIERTVGMPITEGVYKGKYEFITHIFAYGGADMVLEDIRECLRVDVNKYVRVNFFSLIDVIDVLGGIDVEITEKEAWYLNTIQKGESPYPYLDHGYFHDKTGEKEHPYVVGMNHMTGSMALAYSRLRAIDDDFQRIARQRTVIQACSDALKGTDLVTLNKLADTILPLVKTNLGKKDIAELMLCAPSFLGIKFEQMSLPEQGSYGYRNGLNDRAVIALDFEKTALELREFLYGEKDS